MSLWLILLVTVVYFITALLQIVQGNLGFSLMWASYGLANIGIILAGGAK